ncbi:MAG: pantetheine-phosphate adenylyltransferase [Myxococcales bacterium]|nr:pantetheine-phosphate adenylyltransferase [Myxococcales bacterium]
MHQAICAGSFDPPTDGHINIVSRGLKMFDKVIVAVAMNTSKDTLFTVHERVEMLREIFADYQNVEIDAFEGLLVEYAKKRGVHTILRGLRTIGDYDYESQMALANKTLDPDIEFLYMMTEGKYAHISSSVIKEVIRFGGSGCGMIHPLVARRLKEKLLRKGS